MEAAFVLQPVSYPTCIKLEHNKWTRLDIKHLRDMANSHVLSETAEISIQNTFIKQKTKSIQTVIQNGQLSHRARYMSVLCLPSSTYNDAWSTRAIYQIITCPKTRTTSHLKVSIAWRSNCMPNREIWIQFQTTV